MSEQPSQCRKQTSQSFQSTHPSLNSTALNYVSYLHARMRAHVHTHTHLNKQTHTRTSL